MGGPSDCAQTYNRKHGIRYIFGALDIHRDRLYARMRPRRADCDVLGFMRTIRLCYRSRQRIYWIQDNLSANWTSDIRAFAQANRIERVPTPTYAGYLNRIESHFRPIQEFVFNNTDYADWDTARRGRRLHHPPQRARSRPPDRRPRTPTPSRRMNTLLQVKLFDRTH